MWNSEVMGKGACCNTVWEVPNCRGKEAWHGLKSLYIWLSRKTNTKQQNTTAKSAGAKTEHQLWTCSRKEEKQHMVDHTEQLNKS